MELNYELTEGQEREFGIADQFGGSSEEIRKHPEWGPTFMNYFWNAEKEGRAEQFYHIADHICSHPSKKDMAAGKVGMDLTYLYELYQFADASEKKGIKPAVFPRFPLDDDGCVNVDEAVFMMRDYQARTLENRVPLFTGRMPFDNADTIDDVKIFMCEGDPEALSILSRLQDMAGSDGRIPRELKGGDVWTHMSASQFNKFAVMMSLDEMNIRGRQLSYAYEYADGSVERLLNMINVHDEGMVGYVNQKVAAQYLEDGGASDASGLSYDPCGRVAYPLARTQGASSAYPGNPHAVSDWHINADNAEGYAAAGIEPIKVDYSQLDITPGVDTEAGFRIIEAHGFEKCFDRIIKDSLSGEKRVAFFYNRHNGDIVEITGAKPDDINYAGIKLKVWRTKEDWHHGHNSSSGFDHEAGVGYAEFTHHNGVFSEYGSYRDAPVAEQEGRGRLGFQGIGDIPIPAYISIFCRQEDFMKKVHDKASIHRLNQDLHYKLSWMMDMLIAVHDPGFDTGICPDYARLKDDPYTNVMKEHGKADLWHRDIETNAYLFQFAASWMHMPTEERMKYHDALVGLAAEHDKKIMAQAEEHDRDPSPSDLNSRTAERMRDIYLSDPKCPEDIYALGVPKIEDTPYAAFIPWLAEKDFANAVEGIQDVAAEMKI